MMKPNDFRQIALGMQDAIEREHMGHPDFRANGRIFATLSADDRWGMVALSPDQQAEFMEAHPQMFVPAAGAWGRGGSTMVRLELADAEVVGAAMTLAWQRTLEKRVSKATTKTRAKATTKTRSSRRTSIVKSFKKNTSKRRSR